MLEALVVEALVLVAAVVVGVFPPPGGAYWANATGRKRSSAEICMFTALAGIESCAKDIGGVSAMSERQEVSLCRSMWRPRLALYGLPSSSAMPLSIIYR